VSDGRPEGWRRRLRVAVAATVGGGLIRLLAMTWRVTTRGGEGLREVRAAKRGAVFVVWHGELLPALWAFRGQGITALISSHADGEIIARFCATIGFRLVRGSSSRGGARALLELVRELEAGHEVAVTPDGPRGPRRAFAPGALVAAMRAGAPVIAFGVDVDRAWRFRSWDRFVLPKPFARVTVTTTVATPVHATSTREAEGEVPRFTSLLMSVCQPDET
jgi:lysophospholipid acyltransferase (LPLAT)-like uncharacterized protein